KSGRVHAADRREFSRGLRLLDRGEGSFRRNGRAGHRASRRLSRLVRGCADRVSRPFPRRLRGAAGRGPRGADARGERHLASACPLRRPARDLRALQRCSRGALPVRLPRRARRRADCGGIYRPRVRRRADTASNASAAVARGGNRQGGARGYPVVVVVVVVFVVVGGGGFFFFFAGLGFGLVPTSTTFGWLRYDEYHVLS